MSEVETMGEATEEVTEIIETAPAPSRMPAVDPILMPLMLPFMFIQQLMFMFTQMSMPPMMQPMGGQAQQTIVKLGYDKDGNITSVYERRW
jgi:hypothetical protein